jgi:hypothetical protein
MNESIQILDPWKMPQDFILKEGNLKIYGPYSKIHQKRFLLDFYYKK